MRKVLRDLQPGCAETRVFVALSGGADSVALLDCLHSLSGPLGFELLAAHLDHGLRPTSAADSEFCGALCSRLQVPFVAGRRDIRARAARERGGLEQAARRERYAFLDEVRRQERADWIAVAHTQDDQAETVLMRLLRGSGARGLAAMRAQSGRILRPMLGVSRVDVLAHLGSRGLAHREDETNQDPRFTRNRVRHELLPLLERWCGAPLAPRLARTAALLADDDGYLSLRAARLLTVRDGAPELPAAALCQAPKVLARRAVRRLVARAGGLRGVRAVHVERIVDLAARPDAHGHWLPLPGGRRATFVEGGLRVARAPGAVRSDGVLQEARA